MMEKHDYYNLLIKRGILVTKKIENSINNGSIELVGLEDSFKQRFYQKLKSIIDKNVSLQSKIQFDMIMRKVNQLPNSEKKPSIPNIIRQLINEQSQYQINNEAKESMVIDFYSYEDYIRFDDGNLNFLLNYNLKEFIRGEVLKEVCSLLKQEYEVKNNIKSKVVTSYQWLNSPDTELPELYSLLRDEYKLIATETTYEQFKAIFTGQQVESITPVRWHDDNASELLYFIDRLKQTGNIEYTKRADYKKMTACIVKPDGKSFTASFKELKQNLSINLSQDKQNIIDELVNNFI